MTYLTAFALDALQFSPLLDGLGQIDLAEGHFDLADLAVLRESIKVEDGKHQRFVHCVGIWKALRSWRVSRERENKAKKVMISLILESTGQT